MSNTLRQDEIDRKLISTVRLEDDTYETAVFVRRGRKRKADFDWLRPVLILRTPSQSKALENHVRTLEQIRRSLKTPEDL